jgi:diguanylate cyclase (GGDEF)-like protein
MYNIFNSLRLVERPSVNLWAHPADTKVVREQITEPGTRRDPGTMKLMDRIMTVLPEAALGPDELCVSEFRKEMTGYRERVLSGESLDLILRGVFGLCQDYFLRARMQRIQWEHECVELIETLTEAISKLAAGDATSFQADMVAGMMDDLDDERDLTHRVEMLQLKLNRAKDEAATDALTRVANRRTFDKTLRRWVRDHQEHGSTFVLALLDIDDFKRINDTFGHPVGDRVLMEAAQLLAASTRPSDLVARYGGEEFALLLSGLRLEIARSRMEQHLKTIAAHRFANDAGTLQFTLSCGMAEFCYGDTVETLIQRADDGLYEAKKKGKNRVIARK